MRGGDVRAGELFSYVDLEDRVRRDHPLRRAPPASCPCPAWDRYGSRGFRAHHGDLQ